VADIETAGRFLDSPSETRTCTIEIRCTVVMQSKKIKEMVGHVYLELPRRFSVVIEVGNMELSPRERAGTVVRAGQGRAFGARGAFDASRAQ
jgi:hypothetical protein